MDYVVGNGSSPDERMSVRQPIGRTDALTLGQASEETMIGAVTGRGTASLTIPSTVVEVQYTTW